MNRLTNIALTAALSAFILAPSMDAAPLPQTSAEPLVIEPLFDYPVAPDSVSSLAAKSDYLVEHFWDAMDFKKQAAVDQNALNHAFNVYVTPMRWAAKVNTDKSLEKLFKYLDKNPVLSLQFTRAAEEALYGPRADFWADDLYLMFIDNMLANKKVPKARKERYNHQKTLIQNSLMGNTAPEFDYTTPTGNPAKFLPTGVITVIEFGDPDCDDCRMAKLKMETDITFSGLVDRGLVNVLFIIPDAEDGWQTKVADFSPKWHVGASDSVSDIYDLRLSPSFYVIGPEGKIAAKNTTYRVAMNEAIRLANNK